jgi:hypothetical protein
VKSVKSVDSSVAIGLRAKTGRAIAVVLGGSADSPVVVTKLELTLSDPKVPATFQPYHEVMDLPWDQSQKAVRTYTRVNETIARKRLADLIKKLKADGFKVKAVGIVGALDRDLARIGNYHIRAHAAEGVLFRRVLDLAAEANGLKWRVFADKQLEQIAVAELRIQAASVKKRVSEMGRELAPPWRADEKQAATAAWLILHSSRK